MLLVKHLQYSHWSRPFPRCLLISAERLAAFQALSTALAVAGRCRACLQHTTPVCPKLRAQQHFKQCFWSPPSSSVSLPQMAALAWRNHALSPRSQWHGDTVGVLSGHGSTSAAHRASAWGSPCLYSHFWEAPLVFWTGFLYRFRVGAGKREEEREWRCTFLVAQEGRLQREGALCVGEHGAVGQGLQAVPLALPGRAVLLVSTASCRRETEQLKAVIHSP